MALRCFLFSSDEGTSDTIRQVITSLGIEGESCSEAATSVAKVAQELFQIVVVDWDQQPEAGMLLSAARERRLAERPLLLAVVSDDASIPKALQAGANSILKKPLLVAQVSDTMTTARDLLRSRRASADAVQAAAAAAASTSVAPTPEQPSMRSGATVHSAVPSPVGRIETDTEVAHFPEQSAAEQTNPLRDLEPVAASVAENPRVAPPRDEPKGLEWYLKARGVARQPGSVLGAEPPPTPPKEGKPELLGYDQPHSHSSSTQSDDLSARPEPVAGENRQKPEPQLFSSITEENSDRGEETSSRFRLGKGAIAAAVVLASLAIAAAPQAPWHSQVAGLWSRGRRTVHGWLNPQPVTSVTQAPASHENFARPGDEYKLPVAENIPDATTDPSQISVVPVVDPTAKKPAPETAPADPVTVAPDPSSTPAPDPGQPIVPSTTAAQPSQPTPVASQPATVPEPTAGPATTPAVTPSPQTPSVTAPPAAVTASPKRPAPYVPATTKVPSSLQSQMATMTPDASGNKPPEAALPAIEPVEVQELTERTLLTDQPPLAYPASAAGKQGTVTLEVLIGRDGTVEDAKFLQGSLAFARAAIAGVKQWKFKPYTVNGRPVSVQSNLTLRFAPGQ